MYQKTNQFMASTRVTPLVPGNIVALDPVFHYQKLGHSFRRGGASLLYRLGIDPLTIQACGDWSTDTFLRYIEVNIDRLWSAQHAMGSFSCL